MPTAKARLDDLLVQKGLAENLKQAQALVLSGKVMVNQQKITKSGLQFPTDADVKIAGEQKKYASRGGVKLEAALDYFSINPENRICLDIGASTGGFTDVLLSRGAQKIYAFDVGYGQMISRLANDERVVVKDRFNIKQISADDIDNHLDFLAVIDVSFISLKAVLPVFQNLKGGKLEIVALLKPQFEAKMSELHQGIVSDPKAHFRIIKSVLKYIKQELKYSVRGICNSSIRGKDGNREFFLWIQIP